VAIQRRDATAGADLARSLRCAFHATPAALVADPDVHAVIVASPPSAHVEHATAALDRGHACLIEKPLARSAAEAAFLAALAREPGAPLCALGYPLRFTPVVREVRARLAELGPLRSLWLATRHDGPGAGGWRDDPEVAGGGVILDLATHLFDLARWLSGAEFTAVRADVGRATERALESHVQVQATMHGAASDGGAVRVQIEALRGTAGRSGRLEAVGTLGQLVGDFRLGQLAKIYAKADVPLDLPKAAPPLVALLRAFVATLHGTPDPALPTCHDGLQGNVVAEACYRSAADGAVAAPRVP
jgi:predicted dehydrogenase